MRAGGSRGLSVYNHDCPSREAQAAWSTRWEPRVAAARAITGAGDQRMMLHIDAAAVRTSERMLFWPGGVAQDCAAVVCGLQPMLGLPILKLDRILVSALPDPADVHRRAGFLRRPARAVRLPALAAELMAKLDRVAENWWPGHREYEEAQA